MADKKLLIIVPDRLSDLIRKGEITDRYYNPGNLFENVFLVLTNDDIVPPAAMQRTVGNARLSLFNLPRPSFLRSWGWYSKALRPWIKQGVELANRLKPDLIRTHGNFENGFLAAQIKKSLGVPLVVSLHINPEEDLRTKNGWWRDWKNRLIMERAKFFEKVTLAAADWVLPVYEPIREYASAYGACQVKVCYNVLSQTSLREKKSYQLHNPARLVSVGRQFREKNPEHIIRAVSHLSVKLTLIGDGPYHKKLKQLAARCGNEKFEFIKALPNDELCRRLPDFDLFVVHSQYFELSKAVLEAQLTGLPVVINRRVGKQVPELAGDWICLVDNTTEGYLGALKEILGNSERREALGRRAYQHSQQNYSPVKTEKAYADIYRSLVPGLSESN